MMKNGIELDSKFRICDNLVETYELEDGFFCDVDYKTDGIKELWIYHKDYGIKELMFGLPKIRDREELETLIDVNWKEYAFYYSHNYMDCGYHYKKEN